MIGAELTTPIISQRLTMMEIFLWGGGLLFYSLLVSHISCSCFLLALENFFFPHSSTHLDLHPSSSSHHLNPCASAPFYFYIDRKLFPLPTNRLAAVKQFLADDKKTLWFTALVFFVSEEMALKNLENSRLKEHAVYKSTKCLCV